MSAPAEKRPPKRAEIELLLERARELALRAPGKVATILTAWINQPEQAASPKKNAG